MPDWSNGMISDSQSEEEGFDPLIGYCGCGRTAMHRIVVPNHAGSNPVGHITAVTRTDTETGLSSQKNGFNPHTVDRALAQRTTVYGCRKTGTFDIQHVHVV